MLRNSKFDIEHNGIVEEKGMKRIVFNDHSTLAAVMLESAKHGKTVYAALFYDDAVALMREFMKIPSINCGGIDISPYDYNGYDMEYYVSIDSDFLLNVEEAYGEANKYHGGGYKLYDADEVYVDGKASSAIIAFIDESKCFEISFSYDEDDDDEYFDEHIGSIELDLDEDEEEGCCHCDEDDDDDESRFCESSNHNKFISLSPDVLNVFIHIGTK